MNQQKSLTGRIEEHAEGIGIVSEETVLKRAREVAQTNGRRPEEFTESDLEQARLELEGSPEGTSGENDEEAFIVRDGPIASVGGAVHTEEATDEQQSAEQLVEEGVDEAAHDQMREGNKWRRSQDEDPSE